MLPHQCYKLLLPLGFMCTLWLAPFCLWWTLSMQVEDTLPILDELPVDKETSYKTWKGTRGKVHEMAAVDPRRESPHSAQESRKASWKKWFWDSVQGRQALKDLQHIQGSACSKRRWLTLAIALGVQVHREVCEGCCWVSRGQIRKGHMCQPRRWTWPCREGANEGHKPGEWHGKVHL